MVVDRKPGHENFYYHLASDEDVDKQVKSRDDAIIINRGKLSRTRTCVTPSAGLSYKPSIDLEAIEDLEGKDDANLSCSKDNRLTHASYEDVSDDEQFQL